MKKRSTPGRGGAIACQEFVGDERVGDRFTEEECDRHLEHFTLVQIFVDPT